jgi:hypothetical protein
MNAPEAKRQMIKTPARIDITYTYMVSSPFSEQAL